MRTQVLAVILLTMAAKAQFIQQGMKLTGSNALAPAEGWSVAISADGNTIAAGAPSDNYPAGAVWIYALNNGVWTQQGGKLTGVGTVGESFFGWSVALSADGNILASGGQGDSAGIGGVWFFGRTGG